MDTNPAAAAVAESKKVGLGARVADFLKAQYPQGTRRKLVARDFKVSEATARNWLGGHAPTTAYIEEMAKRWQRPFVEAVFQDIIASDAEAQKLATDVMVSFSAPMLARAGAPSAAEDWLLHFRTKLVAEYGADLVTTVSGYAEWALKGAGDLLGQGIEHLRSRLLDPGLPQAQAAPNPPVGCCLCGLGIEALIENAHIPDRRTAPNETARLCILCHRAYDLGLMTDDEIRAARHGWLATGQAFSPMAQLHALWATRTADWSRLHKGGQTRGGARLKASSRAKRAWQTRRRNSNTGAVLDDGSS